MPTVRQITRFTEQELKTLFAHARRVLKSPAMDILVAPACKSFGSLAVITPARIGNAPERNLLRRRLKAIFYEEKLFDLVLDCVVIAKAPAKNLDFNALKTMLIKALQASSSSKNVSERYH